MYRRHPAGQIPHTPRSVLLSMRSRCLFFVFLLFPGLLFAYDNILIITADTLRADYVSCYGSTKVKTPNIDLLASRGVLFKHTVSQTPFTLPSHVSIFTAMIPPFHGVRDNGGFFLDPKISTLAEIYQSNGRKTAAFVGAFPLDSRFGMDQGFQVYDDSYPTLNHVSEISMPERDASQVTDSALSWLKAQGKQKWFAWIHYYDPHFPYIPPERFRQSDPYAGEVAFVDEQVGRLLEFLKKSQQEQNTLIVFTSDHGESLGEHDEKTHGIFAYESTLRVPLIISPMKPKAISQRVRLTDIAPTLLAYEKLSFPGRVQGVSLLPLIEGKDLPLQDSYFEALSMHLNAGWAPLYGFYSSNYKFIQLPVPELYDLSKDPREEKNLCQDKQMCNLWAHKYESFSAPFRAREAAPQQVDPEVAEQLRALGYVSATSAKKKVEVGPQDDPKNLIGIHNRLDTALGFYKRGYSLKALEVLEKIIEEKSDYSIAYLHAAFIYSSEGLPDKAVETLKQATGKGLVDASIQGKLGIYLYEANKHQEAIEHLKLAVKQDPKEIDHWNYLAMAYTASGKFEQAAAAFQEALKVDASDAMTHNNFGTLYLTQKKYPEAIAEFEKAIAANPRVASAYNGLGVAYASQKRWPEAIKSWNQALKENQRNFDAMLNLAFAYLEQKDKGNALRLLQDFEKNAPRARYGRDLARVRSLIRELQ